MTPNGRDVFLDLMRGCAALLVCANHLRAVMLVNYQSSPSASLLLAVFYAVTSVGHQAVILFFVLSGYFVGGSLLEKGTTFSWREYSVARLTRLWVVLIPALLGTAAVDHVLRVSAPQVLSGTYAHLWHLGPQPGGEYSVSVGTFLGNLFFLQKILLPIFGSNDPLWSLAYEFWYYAIFPLLLTGFGYRAGRHGPVPRSLALFAATGILVCLPWAGRFGFIFWLGGVAVRAFQARSRMSRVSVSIALVSFVGGLGVSLWLGKGNWPAVLADLVMVLVTIFLVTTLSSRSGNATSWRLLSSLAFHLSEMSYSLYLCHFPFVLCIGGIVLRGRLLLPDTLGLIAYIGWLFGLLALAWCFWFVFERRTYEIRQSVRQILGSCTG